MKRILCIILSVSMLLINISAATTPPSLISPAAVLMERDSGKVLYQKDAHKKLPPASVTKIMTLLLVMEAIEHGQISQNDIVTVSEHAAGMGGSQVFLEAGEQMSVRDMLKATVIASGNDSATALAEHISGNEEAFVGLMNKRASELGMNDTTFKNCTGLDSDGHLTSAYDIALMSRELIKHKEIKEFTTIWTDSLRNGTFNLANTNKLIRTYKGITGLKTGSTSVAKFCLSATAERDGMELIATIMAAPSSKERFADATTLLNYGFANFTTYSCQPKDTLPEIPVILGTEQKITPVISGASSIMIEKNKISEITHEIDVPTDIKAPISKGQKIGSMKILDSTTVLAEIPLVAENDVKRLGIIDIFRNILASILTF